MSILYCSLCLPDVNELRELSTDLAEIDILEGRDLTAKITTLLTNNLAFIQSISSELGNLFTKGYFTCDQILIEILPYDRHIYSSDIEKHIATNSVCKQRQIAKEMRILNLKLKVLLGNITNIPVQLLCQAPG